MRLLYPQQAALLTALFPFFSRFVGGIIGTTNAALAFAFLGMQFLMLILIQYSVRLSQLTNQVKDLAQQLAILESEQEELNKKLPEEGGGNEEIMLEKEALSRQIDYLNDELGELSEGFEG